MTNIDLPPFKDSNTAIHLPDRKRAFPFSRNVPEQRRGRPQERSEKEIEACLSYRQRTTLSLRLRSDQRFLYGDLNWKPREGKGPPGAKYEYLPENNSHKNLQKVTGFVGGFTWLRVGNQ